MAMVHTGWMTPESVSEQSSFGTIGWYDESYSLGEDSNVAGTDSSLFKYDASLWLRFVMPWSWPIPSDQAGSDTVYGAQIRVYGLCGQSGAYVSLFGEVYDSSNTLVAYGYPGSLSQDSLHESIGPDTGGNGSFTFDWTGSNSTWDDLMHADAYFQILAQNTQSIATNVGIDQVQIRFLYDSVPVARKRRMSLLGVG